MSRGFLQHTSWMIEPRKATYIKVILECLSFFINYLESHVIFDPFILVFKRQQIRSISRGVAKTRVLHYLGNPAAGLPSAPAHFSFLYDKVVNKIAWCKSRVLSCVASINFYVHYLFYVHYPCAYFPASQSREKIVKLSGQGFKRSWIWSKKINKRFNCRKMIKYL